MKKFKSSGSLLSPVTKNVSEPLASIKSSKYMNGLNLNIMKALFNTLKFPA